MLPLSPRFKQMSDKHINYMYILVKNNLIQWHMFLHSFLCKYTVCWVDSFCLMTLTYSKAKTLQSQILIFVHSKFKSSFANNSIKSKQFLVYLWKRWAGINMWIICNDTEEPNERYDKLFDQRTFFVFLSCGCLLT